MQLTKLKQLRKGKGNASRSTLMPGFFKRERKQEGVMRVKDKNTRKQYRCGSDVNNWLICEN